jgi:type II secretory pathway pseudopilin PulG
MKTNSHMQAGKGAGGLPLSGFVVVVAIVAALSAALLHRLADVQQRARDTAARQVLAAVQSAYQARLAMAPSLVTGLAELAAQNPVSWLERPPGNYKGEVDDVAIAGLDEDSWVFDRRDKSLMYVPRGYKSLSFSSATLLRFKVEFPRIKNLGGQAIAMTAMHGPETGQSRAHAGER